MALIAMTTADTIEYVSDLDPSKVKTKIPRDPNDPSKGMIESWDIKDGATKFFLRPLDVFLMGHIYDNASVLGGKEGSNEIAIHTRVNQTNIEAVRFSLAAFENYKDGKGNDVAYETQKVIVNGREYQAASDKVMNTFGVKLIQELAGKVKEISEVTPDEAKNSEQGSLPSV